MNNNFEGNKKGYKTARLYNELQKERKKNESLREEINKLQDMLATCEVDQANLVFEMDQIRRNNISLDAIEKIAFDIIRDYIKETDIERIKHCYGVEEKNRSFITDERQAIVTRIVTRIVERIRKYIKKDEANF